MPLFTGGMGSWFGRRMLGTLRSGGYRDWKDHRSWARCIYEVSQRAGVGSGWLESDVFQCVVSGVALLEAVGFESERRGLVSSISAARSNQTALAHEYDVKGDVPNVINTPTTPTWLRLLGFKASVASCDCPAPCARSDRSVCIRVGDSVRPICVVDACAAGLASDQEDCRSVP